MTFAAIDWQHPLLKTKTNRKESGLLSQNSTIRYCFCFCFCECYCYCCYSSINCVLFLLTTHFLEFYFRLTLPSFCCHSSTLFSYFSPKSMLNILLNNDNETASTNLFCKIVNLFHGIIYLYLISTISHISFLFCVIFPLLR